VKELITAPTLHNHLISTTFIPTRKDRNYKTEGISGIRQKKVKKRKGDTELVSKSPQAASK